MESRTIQIGVEAYEYLIEIAANTHKEFGIDEGETAIIQLNMQLAERLIMYLKRVLSIETLAVIASEPEDVIVFSTKLKRALTGKTVESDYKYKGVIEQVVSEIKGAIAEWTTPAQMEEKIKRDKAKAESGEPLPYDMSDFYDMF